MIHRALTAHLRPRWLEGKPADRLSLVTGENSVAVQFADAPEVLWLFYGELPDTLQQARDMIDEGTKDQSAG